MKHTHDRLSILRVFLVLSLAAAACRAVIPDGGTLTPTPIMDVFTTPSPEAAPSSTAAQDDQPAAGAPTQTAAPTPQTGQPTRESGLPDPQLVNQYDIQAAIDFEALTFEGRQSVTYINTEDTALDALYFRLLPNGGSSYGDGSLEIEQAAVNGQAVSVERSEDGLIAAVPLSAPLQPGEQTQVELAFRGEVPREFGGGYGIYNFSDEVMTLAGWYPILAVFDADGWNLDPVSSIGDSVYSDIAYYQVSVQIPRDLLLVATGTVTETQENGDEITYTLESGPVRDFFMALSPIFKRQSAEVDGITVNSYYLPGSERGGRKALEVAIDSLRIFNQQFGPYPYTELDIVQSPMRYAAGVEFPAIILIGDFLYDNPERDFFSIATSHEVAHQWWYNVVGNDVFDEPWLDEALTSYSSSLYYEFNFNPQSYQSLIDSWQFEYLEAARQGADDVVTQTLQHFEEKPNPGVYSVVVYTKGALFFHALREEIGDEAFFTGLQTYYDQYRFRTATTEDLLAVFEDAAGQELDPLFQEWLYSAQVPASLDERR